MTTTHQKIPLIADEYFHSRGPKKVKGLMDRMSHGKAGLPWLREIFCEMAETHPEFELGDWHEFICDEDGRPFLTKFFSRFGCGWPTSIASH